MRSMILRMVCALSLLACAGAATATNVSGTVSSNTTWTLASSPYVITGTVTVSSGVTLTIEPGVAVRGNNGTALRINGKLTAIGTSSSPILFTSNNATPTAGAWYGVEFRSTADPASRIEHATIRYGGYASSRGLYVESSAPQFANVTVADAAGYGVQITGAAAAPVFRNCTVSGSQYNGIYVAAGTLDIADSAITGNGDYAINSGPGAHIVGFTNMTVTGNAGGTKNAIAYRAGTISSNTTWLPGLPWVALGSVTVGSGTTLTVSPGVTVRVTGGQFIGINGKLTAIGTASDPILFTTNAATPAAGAWYGLDFRSTADPASRMEYATVQYGGYASNRGILIDGSSPQFDHVTVADTAGYGVRITGAAAAPVFRNCTFIGNHWNGIYVLAGTLDIADSAITSNGDYAINSGPGAHIVGFTNMTVTGNGSGTKDAIAFRPGTISAPTTWLAGLPWVLTGSVTVGETGTLTIAPGVTVRSADGHTLGVSGKLIAVGTAASPIVFTTNRTTPAVGAWYGLDFRSTADPTSLVAHATVQWGGYGGAGAIRVAGSKPRFEHVTVSDSQAAAVAVTLSGSRPVFVNCTFLRNASGITRAADAGVDARLSYWGAATGPSGSGPGTGLSVSAGVLFEPWLTAAPTVEQFLTLAHVDDARFNPAIQTTASLDLALAQTGSWTVTITDAASTTVRMFNGTASPDLVVWDGKDNLGVLLPDGTYPYEITTVGPTQNGTPARGRMIVDSTKVLTSSIAIDPYLSPNADGILDTATLSGSSNFDETAWTVTIKNAGGTTVRQTSATGAALSYVWDGRDTGGTLVPDGIYTADVHRTVGTSAVTGGVTTTLDVTVPTATFTSPTPLEVLSNIYENGATGFAIEGIANDANFARWTLDYGNGASPTGWTALKNNEPAAVPGGQFTVWQTANLNNGVYTFRLRVWDKGETRGEVWVTVTLGNFKLSKNADQFKPSIGQTVTYTSIVPFAVTETLTIRNETGAVVRTLANGSRAAGTYNDVWNGLDDAAVRVPDGPYYYVGTVTDGTHTMSWDLTNEMRTEGSLISYPTFGAAGFDPFNNKPLAVTYTFNRPGRLYVIFTPHDHPTPCVAPAYCWKNQMWQESGTHTLYWAGTDDTHKLRPDLSRTTVTSWMSSWAKNAVLLYGTKPTIGMVSVTPPFYGPAAGNQVVSFSFTTYQSQAATIETTFRNMSSGSVLRTITQTNQAPGAGTVNWDGRADNGMWVAPGPYIVTVAITDGIGNTTTGQILTNIAY